MRWPGESGGLLNYETWQRSRSARGVEPLPRPAGWRVVPSHDRRRLRSRHNVFIGVIAKTLTHSTLRYCRRESQLQFTRFCRAIRQNGPSCRLLVREANLPAIQAPLALASPNPCARVDTTDTSKSAQIRPAATTHSPTLSATSARRIPARSLTRCTAESSM